MRDPFMRMLVAVMALLPAGLCAAETKGKAGAVAEAKGKPGVAMETKGRPVSDADAKGKASGAGAPQAGDAFAALAAELSAGVASGKDDKVRVGVGNFVFENTDLLSPFSSLLREELEIALGKSDGLRVVTRDRIADLQMEGKFQNKEILEPGTGVEKVSVEGVKGIVRGRFFVAGDQITVFAELVWLEGGAVQKTRLSIPTTQVRAKLWPDPAKAAAGDVAQVVRPQNVEQSLANVQEMAGNRLAKVPKDFDVQVFTVDGKRAYAAGETVSFRVRAAQECHVAVVCHQSDGTSVVLFPNRWASNTLIPANKAIDVPGTHKSGFEIEIGAPFGSDVVEVIACSQPSELHKALAKFAKAPEHKEENFQVMTRGMMAKGISGAVAQPTGGAVLQWGQDSVVVSTFPKP